MGYGCGGAASPRRMVECRFFTAMVGSMSGLKSCLATLALLAGIGASALAQGRVQGGWTSQFGDQTFGGPAFVAGTFGYGMPGGGFEVNLHGVGGVIPFGVGTSPHGLGFAPFGPDAGRPIHLGPLYGGMVRVSQTASGVAPPIVVVRQSTRPSCRR